MLFRVLASLFASLMAAAPAAAASILFAGTGYVTAVTGFRGAQPTGSVSLFDSFSFATVFDPAPASRIFDGGRGQQVFALPGAAAGAAAGSFTFTQSTEGTSVVILGRGFRVFPGGNLSEPVLNQQFTFNGLPTGSPAFDIGANGRIGLILTSTFLDYPLGQPTPTLADLRNPDEAVLNRFTIAFNDGRSTIGIVEGNFVGGFAAVPEPGAWALLIVGFGAVGGAMRRRPVARSSAIV